MFKDELVADHNFIKEVVSEDQSINTTRLAELLHISKKELAIMAGLPVDVVSKKTLLKSQATQARLRDVLGVIDRVRNWSGSIMQAYAWYRSEPLPSFGDKTAEDLVKEGRAEDVMAYLLHLDEGGYA